MNPISSTANYPRLRRNRISSALFRALHALALGVFLSACGSITTSIEKSDQYWTPEFRSAYERDPSSAVSGFFSHLEECDRYLHVEYPEVTTGLEPGVPHTIQEMDSYLKSKLSNELVASIKNNPETRVILALGPGVGIEKLLKNQPPIKEMRPLSNPFGAFNAVQVEFVNGKRPFLLTNVNGRSRYIQVMSLLRLSGLKSKRITLLGEMISYKSLYKSTFASIGHEPDLVVFGFANTAFESMIGHLKLNNAAEIAEKNSAYAKKKWEMPPFDRHELENLGVQIVTTSSGKRIWFIDNEYGDRAVDLYQALDEHGYKKMIYLGTAGSVNPNFNVGDIVTPQYLIRPEGRFELETIESEIAKTGVLNDVDSPTLETQAWLERQNKLGVDFIEVELAKILKAIHGKKKARLSAYLVISDILQSEKHVDYTKWSEAQRQELRDKIWPLLKSTFQDAPDLTKMELSYEIKKFIP